MRYVATILTILLLLFTPSVSAAGNVRQYNVGYLIMGLGMPSNYVDDIYKDSYGSIWISTHGGGLVRYDGYSFFNLGLGGDIGFGLLPNSCRNVVEDKQGRLWIAFDEGIRMLNLHTGQMGRVEAENGSLQAALDKVLEEPCQRVYCDTKGCVWILKVGQIDRLAFGDDGKVSSVLSARHNTKVSDLDLADLDSDGSVYVGINFRMSHVLVSGGRLRIIDLSKRYPYLAGAVIGTITKWKGRTWFGTNRGLYCDDGRSWHCDGTSRGLQHETVTSLAVAPDGNGLIIGTLCGIDVMDAGGTLTTHLNATTQPLRLSSNFVNTILVSDRRIWIGTETGGITRLVPRLLSLENYVNAEGNSGSISSGPVNAMYSAPNGDLWVGTVEGGLNLRRAGDNKFVHFTTSNSGLTHNSVSCLVADDGGTLWIGTWGGGVCSFSGGTIHPLVVDARHSADMLFVGAMAYDPYNDGLWIGANAGLFFYDFKSRKIVDPFPDCRSINGAIGSIVTRDGKLLMGCVPGMVCVDLKRGRDHKGNFSFIHYIYKLDHPSSKAFDKITSFWQSPDGTLWIGTAGYGMYRVEGNLSDTTKYRNFTTGDGLSSNSVKGIAESGGSLWIATENGLSRLNTKTLEFSKFTDADGLLSNQFYFNGAIKGPGGKIYLGSDKGLTAIYGIDMNSFSTGKLHFTGLYVNNQWAMPGGEFLEEGIGDAEKIHLHESDRNIEVEFSAFSYGCESQGVYSYRLEGYEDEWTKLPPGVNKVRYSALPGGNYTLKVRYASSLNDKYKQETSIAVSVTPYFYKSWWFLLIVLVVITLSAVYFYNKRVEQVRDREAERLYRPIEAALKDSPEPGRLQERIQNILRTQERYRESQKKSVAEDNEQSMKSKDNYQPLMPRVMEVMEKHYSDPSLSVQMLADSLGVSRTVLNKTLQTNVGMGTTQFIRDYRLDVARRFLEDNVAERNITEIAYRVGFNDPKYFTRCFTQKFGTAPSQYLK